MTDLGEAIRKILVDDATISSIVGAKVSTDYLPQSTTPPAVVFHVIFGEVFNPVDDPLYSFTTSRVQFDCYGSNRSEANLLWLAVRSALLSATRTTVADIELKEISQDGGYRYLTDRAESGSQQYRFLTSQDFAFFYCLPGVQT